MDNVSFDVLTPHISLLEKEIFSATAMKRIIKRIESRCNGNKENRQATRQHLTEALSQTEEALTNVANAVASGLLSDALTEKLRELEAEKARLLSELVACDTTHEKNLPTIDGQMIRSKYTELKASPSSPEYKEFIQSFIEKISAGRYVVEITLKTGLDICPALDTTYTVRRQEIYERKKTV